MDLPSRSIVALLEPVRKLSPAYEVNPQYSPNVSGNSKKKKKNAQRATFEPWQENAYANDPCRVLANEQAQRLCMSHIALRTWRVSSNGGEDCTRISEAGQRPSASTTRGQLSLHCLMLSTVFGTRCVQTKL
jgi:hypothetical protein